MRMARRTRLIYVTAVTAALAILALVACGSGQGHITGGTPTGSSPSAGAEPGVDTYVCPGTDSSSAVAAGNQALANAANAISWAQGQGKIIDGEAQQLAATAQNYANSHCG